MIITREKNKIMYFILAFALIAGSGIGYSKLYLYHLVGIYSLLILLVSGYNSNPSLRFNKVYLYLIVFIFYNVLGLTWTMNKSFTIYQTFYLMVGLSIIILTSHLLKLGKQRFFFIPIVFGLGLGLLEISGIARWPLSPYSEYITLFGRAFKGSALGNNIRIPTVFFGNPNDLCLALNYLFCFILFLKKRIYKILLSLLVLLIVFRTGSRGGQITSVFLIFCYFLFFSKKFRLIALLSLPFAGYGVYYIIQKVIIRYNIDYLLNFSYAGTHNSIGIRQQLYLNCFNFLRKDIFSFLFGAGGGASKQIQIAADNTFGIYSTHFFALELLTEYGAFVFIFLIIAYLASLHRTYKISRLNSSVRKYAGTTFLALLVTLPGSVSSSSIIYFFPFWIILGFTVYCHINYRRIFETFTTCRS